MPVKTCAADDMKVPGCKWARSAPQPNLGVFGYSTLYASIAYGSKKVFSQVESAKLGQ
jgi:hypothetical protein